RHTRFSRDWSSDVCSSDLSHVDAIVRLFDAGVGVVIVAHPHFRAAGEFQPGAQAILELEFTPQILVIQVGLGEVGRTYAALEEGDRKSVVRGKVAVRRLVI